MLGSEWWAMISLTRDSKSWGGWWYLGVVCLALPLLCAVTTTAEAMGGGACTPMGVCMLTVARRGVSQQLAFFILVAGASSAAQRQSLRPLMTGRA